MGPEEFLTTLVKAISFLLYEGYEINRYTFESQTVWATHSIKKQFKNYEQFGDFYCDFRLLMPY